MLTAVLNINKTYSLSLTVFNTFEQSFIPLFFSCVCNLIFFIWSWDSRLGENHIRLLLSVKPGVHHVVVRTCIHITLHNKITQKNLY